MKSMTDFIMEQEVSTAPVEVFNESALVSNFMSMHAAAAEVACVLEFASIAEFCTENDINMPEQLVQEGFKDTINKIWTAIAKWFEKVADWFKSLVKGTMNACSTSNLKQILAKLKTYPKDTPVHNVNIMMNLIMVPTIVKYIEKFRRVVTQPMSENVEFDDNNTEEKFIAEFMENIDTYIADLEYINKRSNWQDANGNLVYGKNGVSGNLKSLDNDDQQYIMNKMGITTNSNGDDEVNNTYETLENLIESLISFDIPKTGAKILEELDVDINNFKKLTDQTKDMQIDVNANESAADVVARLNSNNKGIDVKSVFNAMKAAKLISGKGINFNSPAQTGGPITVQYQAKVWQADKDVKTKITKASNLLATGYDLVKVTLTESISKEFKDIKAGDEKSYKKELKSVEKKENSVSINNIK